MISEHAHIYSFITMASFQIEQIIKDGETTPSIDNNDLLGGQYIWTNGISGPYFFDLLLWAYMA